MILCKENYHSLEANRVYMSNSLFKSFLPQYNGCEARAMAILAGDWQDQVDSKALLVGQYVHAWNEGALQEFIARHSAEINKRDGSPRAEFVQADQMIETLRNDPLITRAREGEKEVIFVGELFGMPWKIMIDVYNLELGVITDLKTCREIHRTEYNPVTRRRENMIQLYGYDWQMASYAEIVRLGTGGGKGWFAPHIIAVSKESPPDKELINFGTEFIKPTLDEMSLFAPGVRAVWTGEVEPTRCGKCDYCRATKVLTKAVHYTEIGEV